MRSLFAGLTVLLAASVPAMAADAPVDERFHVLVMDLTGDELPPKPLETLSESLTVLVGDKPRVDVTSGAELRRVMALEAERQTAGCDDESCIAELAGALGARLVVFGQVGAVGERLVMTLSLFDSAEATSVGRAMVEGDDVDALYAGSPAAVDALLDPFLESQGVAVGPPPLAGVLTFSGAGLAAVGVGLAVAGGAAAALYFVQREQLTAAVRAYDNVPSLAAADDVARTRDETDAWAAHWNTWGIALSASGAGVALLGLSMVGGGALYGALATESE